MDHDGQGPQSEPDSAHLSWPVILLAGGAGWLVDTATALLWLHPMSGKVVDNTYYMTTPSRALQHLLIFSVSIIAYAIAFRRGVPDYRARPLVVIALQTTLALLVVRLAPIAAAFATAIMEHMTKELPHTLWYWRPFNPTWGDWLMPMRFFLAPYLTGLALIAMVLMARDYHREALRSAGLREAFAEARLAMLSSQLQPHFLFNALHAISELVNRAPDRATAMLARLGDFLRHALASSKQPWVSVGTEVEGLEAYLAVQQARFGEQMQVRITVDGAATALTMPSMLLQPLIENAIEHGRVSSDTPLAILVAVSTTAQRLQFVVHNSVPHLAGVLAAQQYGDGLNNVALRLSAAYGNAAQLVVGGEAGGGTTARIDIPVKRGL
jgi:hypothetical protein